MTPPRDDAPAADNEAASENEPASEKELDRGTKHVCPSCKCKYFDLKKPVLACPICGAAPPEPEAPKAPRLAPKSRRLAFGRYP